MLEGKVALITGAARGIGRQTALLFAREGACVVVADLSADGAEETVELIDKAGGQLRRPRTHRYRLYQGHDDPARPGDPGQRAIWPTGENQMTSPRSCVGSHRTAPATSVEQLSTSMAL